VNSLAAMYYRLTSGPPESEQSRVRAYRAIVGPLAAGALWATVGRTGLFYAAAIPALISAVATYSLRW